MAISDWLSSLICDPWLNNLNKSKFFPQFRGSKNNSIRLRAGTGNQVSYTEGAFLRFIYGPNLTKNTSKKIENFDQAVLASGDVSEFEKKWQKINKKSTNQNKVLSSPSKRQQPVEKRYFLRDLCILFMYILYALASFRL